MAVPKKHNYINKNVFLGYWRFKPNLNLPVVNININQSYNTIFKEKIRFL
jgi:hypothetical protein